MSVRIQFEKPNAWLTNLDYVTGRVILTLQSDATLSAINVKLEGESKTRLGAPRLSENDRKARTEIEIHKLLYKVVTVFPSPELQKTSTSNSAYTLLAGQYEYPFRIKLPFNNSCWDNNSVLKDLKVGSLSVQFAPDTNKHVKRALPPTLARFPGEAEIKYYIKATVKRPKFYQENLRCQVDIKFLPIEPPRPPNHHQEVFARRKQQFTKTLAQPQKKGLFRKESTQLPVNADEPPHLQLDARLPDPAILTCNEPLPLRILLHKLNESSATIHLSTLQIELISYTNIRAHDLSRTESNSFVVTSQANMAMRFGNPDDPKHKEYEIPSQTWDSVPLPSSTAPSFDTCNISQTYELEVRVGLKHSGDSEKDVRPELLVLPLRLPVKVYSGIKPPPALLRAIATPHTQPFIAESAQSAKISHSPSSPSTPSYVQHPPQAGIFNPLPNPHPGEEEAPPSYEDAMADEVGPVDGPRRDFNIPAESERRPSTGYNDERKGAGVARHPSERLFPQNGIPSHSRASSYGTSSFGDRRVSSSPIVTTPSSEPSPGLPLRPGQTVKEFSATPTKSPNDLAHDGKA